MNKFLKRLVNTVLIAGMLLCAAGCTGKTDSDKGMEQGNKLTITDSAGDTIVLDGYVDEIACTWPSGTQLFITLGMSDLLVSVPKDSQEQIWATHIAPDIVKLPACSNEQSAEEFLNLNADIVITTEAEVARDLRSKGITAMTINYYSVEEMKFAISLLGEIVPAQYKLKCTDYLAYLEKQITDVSVALTDKVFDRSTVYYIHGNNNKGLYKTAGGNTMNEAWANYAYTDFVTASLLSSSETVVDAEAVLATNPEYIVIGGRYQQVLYKQLMETPEWAEISAVINGKVLTAPIGISPFDRFGAEFAMMIPWLASQVYPEHFSYDAVAEVKNFYKSFSGYAMTDQEAEYIVNGFMPDGTREIK